ncbi:Hydrolase, alpha/beta domain protein [uncultured Desulfatiglans sp.]|nr:Hydrolase, alpha/beta domain protein [uncultured Desulfatiglans sp.]
MEKREAGTDGNHTPYTVLTRAGVGFEAGSNRFFPDRPTLLMVHGAGGRGARWLNQTGPLGRTLNTVAVDLPGHGGTAGPAPSEIADYAAWLEGVVAPAFESGVVLMGHSMGGAVALEAALRGAMNIQALILVGTGARLHVAPDFLKGLRERFEETVEAIVGYAYAPGAPEELLKEGARMMKDSGMSVVSGDFEACSRFDCRESAGRIACPALVLCGEADRLTPPKLSEELGRLLQRASVQFIPRAGHMVMFESPTILNRAVQAFIEGL